MEWLPEGFRPFTSVEAVMVPVEPLHEADLMTDSEVNTIFHWADADLTPICLKSQFRKRRQEEYRTGEENPWRGFEDMLRCYHATGARTHELAACQVGDFQPRSRQLVLGSHKRSKSLKQHETRQIALNDTAYTIVERLCHGRDRGSPLFTQPVHGRQPYADRRWDRISHARRFRSVRHLAGVRDSISIYSFRHLWISEMLMAGVDVLLVARMAGTSVAMIERVYGHFRNQSYQDAQARLDADRARRHLTRKSCESAYH
jgi:integrase